MNPTKLVAAAVGTLALVGAIVFGGQLTDPAPTATDRASEKASASVGGTLRIGVTRAEPIYYKADGETKGFDYEMARGVAEGMGAKPEFVEMELNELFGALKAGKIDMIGAQVTKTTQLERDFDFSAPYFETYVSFVVPVNSTIHTRGDVDGKTIAVVAGTIQVHYLEDKYQQVRIVKARDADAAVEMIGRGEADAFFHSAPYAASIIEGSPIALREPIRYHAKEAPIGFVIRSGDPRKEQIDAAIEDMIRDGKWLKIKTAYFEPGPLTEVFPEKGI
jgi:polar amino acid transport system substrate-binding protein